MVRVSKFVRAIIEVEKHTVIAALESTRHVNQVPHKFKFEIVQRLGLRVSFFFGCYPLLYFISFLIRNWKII